MKEKLHTKTIPRAACFPLKGVFLSGRQITMYRSKANRARDQRATMPAAREHSHHQTGVDPWKANTISNYRIPKWFILKSISEGHHSPSSTVHLAGCSGPRPAGFEYLWRWRLHNHSEQPVTLFVYPQHQTSFLSTQVMKGWAIYVHYCNIYEEHKNFRFLVCSIRATKPSFSGQSSD